MTQKPRFELLDGLRGVAAMLVVAFHLSECFSYDPVDKYLNHGYLAVDFFFVLSGFVIGYSYDDRWRSGQQRESMTLWQFCKRRLIRLQPMVFFGSFLGFLCFYFGDCPTYSKIPEATVWMLLGSTLLSAFLIPQPNSWNLRGVEEMSSINVPEWSLFYECVGNILYALVFRRLKTVFLVFIVVFSAFLVLDTSLSLNVFGFLSDWDDVPLSLNAGFALTGEQFYIAMTRLLYPFTMGMLLSRLGRYINLKGGFWLCSLMLVVIICTPYVGGRANPLMDGIFNAMCALVVFPLIVMIGAGSKLKGAKSNRICKFLGEISYPLYISHYPLVYLFLAWLDRNPEAPAYSQMVGAFSIFVADILIAYAAMKLFDQPVRRWLTERFVKR